MPVSWGWLRAADGVRLRHARIAPEGREVRASLILVHGRTEFIEKYRDIIAELIARGIEVFTLDWRGQGLSARPLRDRDKGHVVDFRHYVSDLERFVEEVVRPASQRSLSLLSHSMGGNIV